MFKGISFIILKGVSLFSLIGGGAAARMNATEVSTKFADGMDRWDGYNWILCVVHF